MYIAWAYRMAGLDDPTAAPLVRLEHKAARTLLGTRQRQARSIRIKGDVSDLDAPSSGLSLAVLFKATGRDMLGARDRALPRVAYDTAYLRSELATMRIEDIEGPNGDGAGIIEIGWSKTDRVGEGAFAYLSPATMIAIEEWQRKGWHPTGARSSEESIPISVVRRGVGEGGLHPSTITLI